MAAKRRSTIQLCGATPGADSGGATSPRARAALNEAAPALVKACLEGDEAAWDKLWIGTKSRNGTKPRDGTKEWVGTMWIIQAEVRKTLRSIFGSRAGGLRYNSDFVEDTAMDVSELFLKTRRSRLRRYKPEKPWTAYVRRIARDAVSDALKRDARQRGVAWPSRVARLSRAASPRDANAEESTSKSAKGKPANAKHAKSKRANAKHTNGKPAPDDLPLGLDPDGEIDLESLCDPGAEADAFSVSDSDLFFPDPARKSPAEPSVLPEASDLLIFDEAIQSFFDSLTPTERKVYRLLWEESLSPDEAARKMKVALGTIYKHKSNILNKLYSALKKL